MGFSYSSMTLVPEAYPITGAVQAGVAMPLRVDAVLVVAVYFAQLVFLGDGVSMGSARSKERHTQ